MNWNYSDDIHSVIDNETYDKGVTTMMIVAMEVTRTGAPSTAHLPRFYLCLIWNKLASVESSFFCLNRFNIQYSHPCSVLVRQRCLHQRELHLRQRQRLRRRQRRGEL